MSNPKFVNILDANGKSYGTGFFASPYAHILTCRHVLVSAEYTFESQKQINYRYAGSEEVLHATYLDSNSKLDIAVLQANEATANTNYYRLADKDLSGQKVRIVGFRADTKIDIHTEATFHSFADSGALIQLGEADAVAPCFSGAAVSFSQIAVGMVKSRATSEDERKREEIKGMAWAIPARVIMEAFPQYVRLDNEPGKAHDRLVGERYGYKGQVVPASTFDPHNNIALKQVFVKEMHVDGDFNF